MSRFRSERGGGPHTRDQQSQAKQKQLELRQAQLKNKYVETLKGREDKILPNQVFESKLTGVEKVIIFSGGAKENPSAMARLFIEGQKSGPTFTISKKGELNGPIPRELADLTREDIYEEVLHDIEGMNLTHLIITDKSFLKPDEPPTGIPLLDTESKKPKNRGNLLNPDRLIFLSQLKGRLFTTTAKLNGFNGYSANIFPDYALLESEELDNALYIVDFTESLNSEKFGDKYSKANLGRIDDMTQAEREELVDKLPWPVPAPFKKSELRAVPSTTRVLHKGDWKTRVTDALAKRDATS